MAPFSSSQRDPVDGSARLDAGSISYVVVVDISYVVVVDAASVATPIAVSSSLVTASNHPSASPRIHTPNRRD